MDRDSVLLDVSGLSLEDVAGLPDTALATALHEVLGGAATPPVSGFSSRLRRPPVPPAEDLALLG